MRNENNIISSVSIKEIIKSTPNGNLKDIQNLSSIQLIEKYVKPFYKKLASNANLK